MLENEDIIRNTLARIDDRYLEFALTRLLNRNKEFVFKVMEHICEDYDYINMAFDISRIDKILDFIYYRYHDFKISKSSAVNLIKQRSKYIPKFMNEYDFTESEREEIYNAYKWLDNDFSKVYSLYLTSGNKKDLLSEKEAKAKFDELQLRRKIIRVCS